MEWILFNCNEHIPNISGSAYLLLFEYLKLLWISATTYLLNFLNSCRSKSRVGYAIKPIGTNDWKHQAYLKMTMVLNNCDQNAVFSEQSTVIHVYLHCSAVHELKCFNYISMKCQPITLPGSAARKDLARVNWKTKWILLNCSLGSTPPSLFTVYAPSRSLWGEVTPHNATDTLEYQTVLTLILQSCLLELLSFNT